MREKLLAAVLASLALPGLATAAEREADDGIYLRAGAGLVELDAADDGGFAGDDRAHAIGLGWRFLNWFSVDAGYDHLGRYAGSAPGAGGSLDARMTALSLGLGATVDFGDSGFFAQARAGMHRWEARLENFETRSRLKGTDPFHALGIGYDVSETFGVILSYERFVVDDPRFGDMDRLMLGFELR